MEINFDFAGFKKVRGAVSARPKIAAVNLSGDELRKHERIMEYRNRANELNANFQSAMSSLASANSDIDRLNVENAKLKSEIERLQGELRSERERSFRSSKGVKKNRRFMPESESSL